MHNDVQYRKSLALFRKLELQLGTRRQGEWLSEYREWLEANGIQSEADGWPTPQAHDDHNINLFVRQKREAA